MRFMLLPCFLFQFLVHQLHASDCGGCFVVIVVDLTLIFVFVLVSES